ncbi:hypothetical protein PA598K_01062 [Paenibacillus sp. 598K]|uniref:sporulation protein YpjB n=1 Tax=Paenibacillus sp. 598K TaxID=1117987 RepID=UPI000FFA18E6|nr:sporulation protein YpjB [Paenibacillus sp. 598K]GBF72794.1 hypothetical protein PA598K_01062 [Paenibacillus sp. 598K]
MRRQGLGWIMWTAIMVAAITGVTIFTSAESRATAPAASPDQLSEAAQALYRSAAEGNRQLVYQQVQRLRQKAADPQLRAVGQAEGWQEVDNVLSELTTRLQGRGSVYEVRLASARLSLAFDALSGGAEAAWRSYYPVIRDDISRLNKAWHRQTEDYATAALAVARGMREHYRMIEAAALLQQQSGQVHALEMSLHYITSQLEQAERDQRRYTSVSRSIHALSDTVDRLFERPVDSVPDPVIFIDRGKMPLRFIFLLGVLIVAVLLYAGWQRYIYDRNRYTGS